MTYRDSVAARQAANDARLALANGGTIEIRSGAQPATPETAATGTLLATFTLPATAFGATNASGVATLNAVADTTGAADGTAGWARVKGSGGAAVFDGSVGTSGAEFTINSTAITTGGTVKMLSGSVTQP